MLDIHSLTSQMQLVVEIMKIIIFICVLVTMPLSMYMDNFTKFSFVRDTITLDGKIQSYLDEHGYGKCKPYFINKYSENYQNTTYYPYVKLNDSIYIVDVSTIPGDTIQRTFSLLIKKTKKIEITDTFGPFYDKYPGAIKITKPNILLRRITLMIYDNKHNSVSEHKYKKENGKFKEIIKK
jgi:hypothetical protein